MPQSKYGIYAHSESSLKYSEEIQTDRNALVTKQFPIINNAKQNGVPIIEIMLELYLNNNPIFMSFNVSIETFSYSQWKKTILLCANNRILIMSQARPSETMGPFGMLFLETTVH